MIGPTRQGQEGRSRQGFYWMARCCIAAGALILNLLTPSPLTAQEPPPVHQLIEEAAAAYGVDPVRLMRIARCESGLNPFAVGLRGERGLLQFEKSTWQELAPQIGVAGDFDEAFKPASNVFVGAYSLAIGQAYRWSCK